MINRALENPRSIAVLGASNNPAKPGNRLVVNLLLGGYKGEVYPVNPKEATIHGLKCYNSIHQLPQTDMAILALQPRDCVAAVEEMAGTRGTKAFIIVSAGFAETSEEGRALEGRLKELDKEHELAIIGPNCIGVMNSVYKAIFVCALPVVAEGGVDYVSASGAFAVFLFEQAALQGLRFGSVYSVGNSVTIGVEEVLQYWDENFVPGKSGKVKLVYAEQIRKPISFFSHIYNLRKKGCQVIVLKPGDSEAGARAALSHTGSMAGDQEACDYLIRKAGAIRCFSREELVCLAGILSQKELRGNRIAIITHAGGPAVMLSDQLHKEGFEVPELDKQSKDKLLEVLYPGSSPLNPIDMMATANRDQLAFAIDLSTSLDYIDAIIVIYGKTGLEDLFETYNVLSDCIEQSEKPVYAVLPGTSTGREEIESFISTGHPAYFNEIVLAHCLGKIRHAPPAYEGELYIPRGSADPDPETCILTQSVVAERLKKCDIPQVSSYSVKTKQELDALNDLEYPLVAKVLGVLHKTEQQGVILNIRDRQELLRAFDRLSEIEGCRGVMIQKMLQGVELYLGAKRHGKIGFSIHAGAGGIFIELLHDTVAALAPLSHNEALDMLMKLKSKKLFEGFRNLPAVDRDAFAGIMVKFSRMFPVYPDITEIDLNPLIADGDRITVVDARIIAEISHT